MTALPAAAAALAISACVPGGVQMSTMSTSGRFTSSRQSTTQSLDSVGLGGVGNLRLIATADHAQARPAWKRAHHRRDRVRVRVGSAHHPVADDADPDLRWSITSRPAGHARGCSLGSLQRGHGVDRAGALERLRRGRNARTIRPAPSARRRRCHRRSAATGTGTPPQPLVPNTSTLHTSPSGKRRPSEITAVVPCDSSAIACALSGSPGHGSAATP